LIARTYLFFGHLVAVLEQSSSQIYRLFGCIIAGPVPLNMVVNYQHPIQCIRYVERQTAGSRNLFLASAGSKIYTYAAETGKQLAIWPEAANTADSTVVSVAPSSEGDEPSAKKRKVSPAPEQTAKRGQPETSTAWSTIPILAVSSDGNFVVAVTGEDKCLRVFEIEESGSLKQLSERYVRYRLLYKYKREAYVLVDICPSDHLRSLWLTMIKQSCVGINSGMSILYH
jgi:hypothetical protein